MYGNDEHTLIGHPCTEQHNISPECLTTAYSAEPWIDKMSYNSINFSGNEGICHMSPSFIPNINNSGWFSRMSLVSEVESENYLVRRVFSNDDLQINAVQGYSRSESPLSSESSSIIESMSRAYPYSPEEKKERIERYRSKRSQRNFTKKIKYECRKTLADSRPRVRGRFAKNEEIEKSSQSSQWSHEDDIDQDNWLNFLDSFPSNLIS